MVDILSNIISVHLFASQKSELSNFRKYLDEYIRRDQGRDWYFIKMFCFQGISFLIYRTLCFILLIDGSEIGNVTVGDFALLITVNVAIVNYLWNLSDDIQYLSELMGNILQGLELILSPVEIKDKINTKPLRVDHGRIIFGNVNFNYKGTIDLFDNKSIVIAPNQRVGLVGYSGSGKSTFVNLILRLYDVTKGSILIDENDIRDVTLHSLRENIAMIPQDPLLFHRTLKKI